MNETVRGIVVRSVSVIKVFWPKTGGIRTGAGRHSLPSDPHDDFVYPWVSDTEPSAFSSYLEKGLRVNDCVFFCGAAGRQWQLNRVCEVIFNKRTTKSQDKQRNALVSRTLLSDMYLYQDKTCSAKSHVSDLFYLQSGLLYIHVCLLSRNK